MASSRIQGFTETSPLLGQPFLAGQSSGSNESDDVAQRSESQHSETFKRHHDAGEDNTQEPNASASATVAPNRTLRLLLIMSGSYIAAFLAALDSTLVATLTSPVASYFDSTTLFSWLASSYFIANAASQPLAGKLTDIYGRKNGMLLSIALFGVGNLVCGFAQSKEMLIFGRVVAGLGGGGIGPVATVLVNDLVPLRSRVLWRGVINICFGVGSGLGGLTGGFINDKMGWRWAFVLQTPPTLLAIILVMLFQNSSNSSGPSHVVKGKALHSRVDYIGAGLLVVGVTTMLLGLNVAGSVVPWSHPLVITTLSLSVLLLVAFTFYEGTMAKEPIVPTKLLLHQTMLSACGANWLVTAARFGVLFYAPVFFYAQGYSSTATGVKLIPESVALGVCSIGCGLLIKRYGKYRLIANCIGFIFTLGILGPVFFNKDTSTWLPLSSFTLIGIGYSGVMSVTLIAMIAAVDDEFQAVMTSTSYVFRSTRSMLGITLASTVFQNLFRLQLRKKLGGSEEVEDIIKKTWNNFEAINHLPHDLRPLVTKSYFYSLRGVFGLLFGIGMTGSVTMAFMREHDLDRK